MPTTNLKILLRSAVLMTGIEVLTDSVLCIPAPDDISALRIQTTGIGGLLTIH